MSPAEQRQRLLETYRPLTAARIDAKIRIEPRKAQYEAMYKGGQDAPLTPESIAAVEADPLVTELQTRRAQLLEAREAPASRPGEPQASTEEIDSRIQATDQELQARRLEKINQYRQNQMERAKLDLLAALDQYNQIDQEVHGVEAAMEAQGIHLTPQDLRPVAQENLRRLGAMRAEARARMEALRSQYEVYEKGGIQKIPATPEMVAAADADPHAIEFRKQRSRLLEDRAVLLDRQKKGESMQQDLDRADRRIAALDARIAEARLTKLNALKEMQLERVRLDLQAAINQVNSIEQEYREAEAGLADLTRQVALSVQSR